MEEASREAAIEMAVSEMKAKWSTVSLTMMSYKDSGIRTVSCVEDVWVLLDDHIIKCISVSKPSANLNTWKLHLEAVSAMLDSLCKVQEAWISLEPVFAHKDFCKLLPTEANIFQQAKTLWKSIMDIFTKYNGVVMKVMNQTEMKIKDGLEHAQSLLEKAHKGLDDYLEKQRIQFPRLYFLSNNEMLEILVKTLDDPESIQPHLRKCFEGIDRLRFDLDKVIVGMASEGDMEYVAFSQRLAPSGVCVLTWLQQVEKAMRQAVKESLSAAIASYQTTPRGHWVMDYPGQVVLAASQVHWTAEVTKAIQSLGLKVHADKLMKQLEEIVKKIRCKLSKNERMILQALLTIDVHSRDVVLFMERNGLKSVNDFHWIAQLRHYQEDSDLLIRMINTTRQYGYEYLGRTERLVITPLTDRCYITMMGALQMNLGGNPQGPAGTGKTETVKDLAKTMGQQCVVFACSDQIDYKVTAQLFKGIAQTGSWAVFDEFNRINIETLSTIAQQVRCIQRGIAEQQEWITLDGTDISLNKMSAIFLTLNPGYAGRTQLPDVLKAMFRPVAMMVPDYALISETRLYCSGFLEAKSLATKLVTTFRLASEQLSRQDHYDFGMRAVMMVVRVAGNLKEKYPDTDEHVLLLSSLNNTRLPMMVHEDIELWQGILSDVFMGVESSRPYYGELHTTITERLGVQAQPSFIQKVIQIYDLMLVRHSLMVVGRPMSGKSTAIKTLAASLNNLSEHGLMNEDKVQMECINPKSLSHDQLYGCYGPGHTWTYGVLSNCFREFAMSTEDRKWIVLDGPVDAIWVENLNTVMDDNKKLCLANGEHIGLGRNMTIMFEVQDLANASPATVSRCGMVYMEPMDLGWETLVSSWMKKDLPSMLNINQRNIIKGLFDWLLPPTLSYISKCCHLVVECGDMHLTMNLLKLYKLLLQDLQSLGKDSACGAAADLLQQSEHKMEQDQTRMITSQFIFAVMWSVGAVLDAPSKTKFDSFIRGLCNGKNRAEGMVMVDLPKEGLLYDYVYTHHKAGSWVHWRDLVQPTMMSDKPQIHDVIVETVETVRQCYFLQQFVREGLPILFVGPTGTGKSLITNSFLESLWLGDFAVCNINFSAHTTADYTHNSIFAQVEKKAGNMYAPSGNKTMCVFVDDLNATKVDCWGSKAPIEVLRQGIDNQQWFDRQTGEKQHLENFIMMAAMGVPGGGRTSVSPRFLRHFNVIGMDSFGEETLRSIFTPIMDSHFATGFDASLRTSSKMIVSATTEIYNQALATFLPTPAKPHYIFSIRDFSKVIQGVVMLSSAPGGDEGSDTIARLWVHEVYCVFYDKLTDVNDRSAFFNMVKMTVEVHFSKWFDKLFGHLSEPGIPVKDSNMQGLLFAQNKGSVYTELKDGQLKQDIDQRLRASNPRNVVAFPSFVKHVSHIAGVLNQPRGHCLLLGVCGSGRNSAAYIGSSMSNHQLYQIDVTKRYNMADWRQDMRRMIQTVGETAKPTVFLFGDHQIKEDAFLVDINMLLKTGYIPDLFDVNQKQEIIQKMKTVFKGDLSSDELYNKFKRRVQDNLHLVLTFSPAGDIFRRRLLMFPALVNCCSIDYFQAWPEDGLNMVADRYLDDVHLSHDTKVNLINLCKDIHQSVSKQSKRFKKASGRTTYVTLATYIDLLKMFKNLLQEKKADIKLEFYKSGAEKLNDAMISLKSAHQSKKDKVELISGEHKRWEESFNTASEKDACVLGDVLLAAAVVTYMGPYTIDYRQECVNEWHQMCAMSGVNVSETFSLSDTIGNSFSMQQWAAAGLPLDKHSAVNAIIATSAGRWPLIIDPQGQANKWIRNMEGNELEVVKKSDANYLRTIENCVQFGTPCLLEDVGEELDPVLEPVLARRIFKLTGADCIQLGDHIIEYNNNFRLYMTTLLSNPHYLPEVAVKVNLVNFGLTPLSLEKQLLALVYAKEKPDITRDINLFVPEIAAQQKKLSDMEERMLKELSETKGNVLDDAPLLQSMMSSQKLSAEISEKKEHLEQWLRHREMVSEHYSPFGRHSAMLYFTIADLASVDPMYQYSISWFINIFINSVEKADKIKALEPRLKNLTDHLTNSIYQTVCQSLFEKHRLLFSFLLCVGVLRAQNAVDEEEYRFLLTGGTAVPQTPVPNPAPEWLQNRAWVALVKASSLPTLSGLLKHIQNNSEEWKKFHNSPNPETKTYPSPWGDEGRLSIVQRLIVLRCLRPDKIVPAVKAFISDIMGPSYIQAPTCNLSLNYSSSTAATPLIMVLSDGADPTDMITQFATHKGTKMTTIYMGEGQGPEAERLIHEGAAQGTWVVLYNCHLIPSWMSQLERICQTVLTDSSKTKSSFRLWLTSYPNKDFPVSILQTGIRMMVEPPRGLKANLLHALQDKLISDPKFFNGSNKPKAFQKLLFGLCYFHALVMERRQFGPIGFNIGYDFSICDLHHSAKQLQMFINEYSEVPLDALKYLAGEANYGGRVKDDWDRRLTMSLLSNVYCEAVINDDLYKFSKSGTYYAPPHGNYQNYISYVQSLPDTDKPEAFGLHENADIMRAKRETQTLFDSVLCTLPEQTEGREKSIEALSAHILSQIPANFNIEEAQVKYSTSCKESMNVVLVQELCRYNNLLATIRNSLQGVLKAVQGLIIMTAELQQVASAMLLGHIPEMWKRKSYASVKSLGSYISDLVDRLEYFQDWITAGTPSTFWISGFFFPQAFMTGALQNYARQTKIPVDSVGFQFEVMDRDSMPAKPESGVYVRGLYMEGARWDKTNKVIAESHTDILHDRMPAIWFKPTEKSKITHGHAYSCPVYKTSERRGVLSTTGHSTNFVLFVDLPTDTSQNHWVNRGVALLCQLDD